MSDQVTRAEVEAHLRTVRAEAETVKVVTNSKLDQVIGAINDLKENIHRDLQAVKDDNKNTRKLIAGVFIGTVLAALAALWGTQSNLLAAFQSGLTAHPAAEVVRE